MSWPCRVLEHFSGEEYRPQRQDRGDWRWCGSRLPGGWLLLMETLRMAGLGRGQNWSWTCALAWITSSVFTLRSPTQRSETPGNVTTSTPVKKTTAHHG